MWPRTVIVVELPDVMNPDTARARINTMQNKIIKQALTRVLVLDWARRVSEHFRVRAKTKYNHYSRSARTIARKKRGGFEIPDLVKSGKLRDYMRKNKPKVTTTGNAWGGRVTAISRMSMPKHLKQRRASMKGVTIARMAEELSRWTREERLQSRKQFLEIYVKMFRRELKNRPRLRKRYGGRI